jgi:hypothetical protein
MPKVRAAVITDIHYGHDHGWRLGTKAPRLMKKFVKEVNGLQPDCVIDMGDRISRRNAGEDRSWMAELKTYFNQLAAPVHHLIGNHDLRFLTRQENEEITGSPGTSYSRDINGYHFIFWNPNVNNGDTGLKLDPEDIDWLKADLAANDKPAVLFCHVPFDNDEQDNEIALTESQKATGVITNRYYYREAPDIRKMLEESGNVILAMGGHRHMNRHREINGIHYFTQQSLTNKYRKEYRVPTGTWTELELNNGQITIHLHGHAKMRFDGKLNDTVTMTPRFITESTPPQPADPQP